MKHALAAMLLANLVSLGLIGCTDSTKSSVKQETKVSTPGGTTTTTIKTEKDVTKTGEHPPGTTP